MGYFQLAFKHLIFFADRVLDDRASPTAVAKTQFEILRRFNESQLYRAGAAGAAGGHPGAPGPGPPHPVASHIINSNLQSSSVTAEIMRMAVTVSEQDNGDPISGSGKGRFALKHSILSTTVSCPKRQIHFSQLFPSQC